MPSLIPVTEESLEGLECSELLACSETLACTDANDGLTPAEVGTL